MSNLNINNDYSDLRQDPVQIDTPEFDLTNISETFSNLWNWLTSFELLQQIGEKYAEVFGTEIGVWFITLLVGAVVFFGLVHFLASAFRQTPALITTALFSIIGVLVTVAVTIVAKEDAIAFLNTIKAAPVFLYLIPFCYGASFLITFMNDESVSKNIIDFFNSAFGNLIEPLSDKRKSKKVIEYTGYTLAVIAVLVWYTGRLDLVVMLGANLLASAALLFFIYSPSLITYRLRPNLGSAIKILQNPFSEKIALARAQGDVAMVQANSAQKELVANQVKNKANSLIRSSQSRQRPSRPQNEDVMPDLDDLDDL